MTSKSVEVCEIDKEKLVKIVPYDDTHLMKNPYPYITHTSNHSLFKDLRKCTQEYHVPTANIIGWQGFVSRVYRLYNFIVFS